MSIKQIEYKNADMVICEFMATKEYDDSDPEYPIPKYKDFNLQEFHDFVQKQIDTLDAYLNYRWKSWTYKKQKSR